MNRGVPPTARNARTGEFTPPGVTACARSNRAREAESGEVMTPVSQPAGARAGPGEPDGDIPRKLGALVFSPVRRRQPGLGSRRPRGRIETEEGHMRHVVRRLRLLRLPATAGKRGLPLTLAAFAVIAGASTAASTASGAGGANLDRAPAGATVLPPAVPPTYSYPGSTGAIPGVPTAPSTDGTASTAGPAGGTPGGEAAPQLAASGIPA